MDGFVVDVSTFQTTQFLFKSTLHPQNRNQTWCVRFCILLAGPKCRQELESSMVSSDVMINEQAKHMERQDTGMGREPDEVMSQRAYLGVECNREHVACHNSCYGSWSHCH
ncbi:hypothetical protein GOODEAATRI_034240 [Goodea atripinnis]|uniref:Uncharacterized protein n=1 Tax=Goodea atripinnis TaxID=208336 RepID=A0ABV0P9Y9_9TELE